MEDFDILYMMKTPFFLGNFSKVIDEGKACEINVEDQANVTAKSSLMVRALITQNDIPALKEYMTSLMGGDAFQ